MKKSNFKCHAYLFALGFARMVIGALTAVLIAAAVYGYSTIPSEGGYSAVMFFVTSTAALALALAVIYAMGGTAKKNGSAA